MAGYTNVLGGGREVDVLGGNKLLQAGLAECIDQILPDKPFGGVMGRNDEGGELNAIIFACQTKYLTNGTRKG